MRPHRRRKIGARCGAGYIGIACGIDCDSVRLVVTCAAEVSGIIENRVDYELPSGIVLTDNKTHRAVVAYGVLAVNHLGVAPVGGLIADRRFEHDFVPGLIQHQPELTGVSDLQFVHAVEFQRYGIGVTPFGYNEVVLELAIHTVIPNINAVVDIVVLDRSVVGDVGLPMALIIADNVVAGAVESILAGDDFIGVRADHIEAHDVGIVPAI